MNSKKLFKRLVKIGFYSCLLLGLLSLMANCTISGYSDKCFDDIDGIDAKEVGLILGCSKNVSSGYENPYFTMRVNAAVKLYKAGKVKKFLISGDNKTANYDEPQDFKDALIAHGIPSCVITLDYAGFRTLDSVVRAKKIFGLSSFIVISQEFHNKRAVFLAESYDIEAIGFNAKDVGLGEHKYREYMARTKAFLDIYLLFTSPKFLGKKEAMKRC